MEFALEFPSERPRKIRNGFGSPDALLHVSWTVEFLYHVVWELGVRIEMAARGDERCGHVTGGGGQTEGRTVYLRKETKHTDDECERSGEHGF